MRYTIPRRVTIIREYEHPSASRVNENNTKFESDFKIRNQDRMFIFNEIQKDLRQNQYSVLRDSDILDPKMDFLVKKLPLTDFEFTDLIL